MTQCLLKSPSERLSDWSFGSYHGILHFQKLDWSRMSESLKALDPPALCAPILVYVKPQPIFAVQVQTRHQATLTLSGRRFSWQPELTLKQQHEGD